MFGLIGPGKTDWKWAVFGKHPTAGDYLQTGNVIPLLKGFSTWMDNGFARFKSEFKDNSDFQWKFWAKGPNGELICGALQSSIDKYGRKYPLLIIGAGKVPGMNKRWNLIPYACSDAWESVDVFLKKKFGDVNDLKRELAKTVYPVANWSSLIKKFEKDKFTKIENHENGLNSDFMNKLNNIDRLSRLNCFSVNLDTCDLKKNVMQIAKLLNLLKARSNNQPEVVFLGGSRNLNRIVCLKRSLLIDDFSELLQ